MEQLVWSELRDSKSFWTDF